MINLRQFVALTFILTVSVAQATDHQPVVASDKPNVIVFFIDDLGYLDLGCYSQRFQGSSRFYETPNIDRLASESCVFTDFYSAHPVCSPTRAALMTGKAPQRVGITQWISQPSEIHLAANEFTLGEAFKEAGYQTGYVGKWHLGEKDEQLPTAQGFDWSRGVNRAGQPGSYFHPFQRKKRAGVNYWDVPDLEHTSSGDYLTDKLTDQAIEFVETNQAQPFFLCFAHYAVHTPIQSPKHLVDKFKTKRETTFAQATVAPIQERNNSNSRARQDDPAYAAMLENLDFNVGRLLQRVNELKLREKTIVLFTSDNGGLTTLKRKRVGPTSVRPLRAGKGWNYEGGIRVPTLVRWPNKIKAGITDVPAITTDIYPTLLELTGLPPRPDQHLDGRSLVAAIKGEPSNELRSRFLAWHYPHPHGSGHTPSNAIRKGPWKLIHHTEPF